MQYYNAQRRHSAIDNQAPLTYLEQCLSGEDTALLHSANQPAKWFKVADPTEDRGGAQCPEYERVYCDTCVEGQTEESRAVRVLRDGDSYSRAVTLCPSCKTKMILL